MTAGQPTVAILGSTGSIGTQTIDVVRQLEGGVRVVALGAGRSVELLAAQADELRPDLVVVGDAAGAAAGPPRSPACCSPPAAARSGVAPARSWQR